jgi:PhnB protein
VGGSDDERHLVDRPVLDRRGCAGAIEFYKQAFGATERVRLEAPESRIGHAELVIGGASVMVCDALPWFSTRSPKELGGTSASVLMHVADVDAVVRQAVDAGATVARDVADQFWGDRLGEVHDPFGHSWLISTHVEDLTPEEIAERARAARAG